MRTKIAIITTIFLEDFVRNAFNKIGLPMDVKFFIYHSYRDIPTLYETIGPEYQGIITSGIFPAAIIMKCRKDTSKNISYFNTDDASICRLFLSRFIEDKKVDLSRVYGDFVEIFGISLKDYLTRDQSTSYTNLIDPKVLALSLEEIYALEEEELKRHIMLHESGAVDFSVSRFSSIIPQLKERGYPVYFPFPSQEFLKNTAEKLLQDLSIRRLKENRTAVIHVSVGTSDGKSNPDSSFQLKCITLEEALLSFHGNSMLDYVLQRIHTGFEILTTQKMLASYTEDFTVCTLTAFLHQRLSFPVTIGYGIGSDIYQARMNAMNAEREASLSGRGSYLINQNDELLGPLGEASATKASAFVPENFRRTSGESGLSPLTISRVYKAFHSMPDQQLTSTDVANKLSITKRSASRFLAALLNCGAIEIAAQKRATTKGRPERVYHIKE